MNRVRTTLVLMPSVLLGAPSVAPLAVCLEELGRSVRVADTAGASTPEEVAARYRAAVPDGPVTCVAHSNAGLYLSRLVRDRPGAVGILVDASLPVDDPPHVSAAGARLEALRELADTSGRLPGWVDWWAAEQLRELVPDADQRHALRGAGPRLPLSYFTSDIDAPEDWRTIPAGYLSFDGGYVGHRERMSSQGWPTRHVPGGHLSLLTKPREVALAIVELEAAVIGSRDPHR